MIKLSKEQKNLIEKLVGKEANKHSKTRKNNIRFGKERWLIFIPIEKLKQKVYESFGEIYNPKTVRDYMLEYLDLQISIAGTYNESFNKLKKRIENDSYDFDFSKFVI